MTAAATTVSFIILIVTVDLALSAIFNNTLLTNNNVIETRRKSKKHHSTSSSSDSNRDSEDSDDRNTLEITSDSTETSDKTTKEKKSNPEKITHLKSSEERKGWRKWHRKCTPCPEDMRLKWRDPSIKWICGAYQRARRSFKSLCMMHFRNCQDGTMFVKLADHRCQNDSERTGWRAGDHFFYEYNVRLRDDSSKTESTSSEESGPLSTD